MEAPEPALPGPSSSGGSSGPCGSQGPAGSTRESLPRPGGERTLPSNALGKLAFFFTAALLFWVRGLEFDHLKQQDGLVRWCGPPVPKYIGSRFIKDHGRFGVSVPRDLVLLRAEGCITSDVYSSVPSTNAW